MKKVYIIETPAQSNYPLTTSLIQMLIAEDSLTLKPGQIKVTEIKLPDEEDNNHPMQRPHRP